MLARLLPAVALILLAACREEPSFDERYAKAEASIREKAAAMDRELARAEHERREAEQAAAERAGTTRPAPPSPTR